MSLKQLRQTHSKELRKASHQWRFRSKTGFHFWIADAGRCRTEYTMYIGAARENGVLVEGLTQRSIRSSFSDGRDI